MRKDSIRCPACNSGYSKVTNTYTEEYTANGKSVQRIRRRRLCRHCNKSFYTRELPEEPDDGPKLKKTSDFMPNGQPHDSPVSPPKKTGGRPVTDISAIPTVTPWRCPTCGNMIEVEKCLKCSLPSNPYLK